MTTKKTLDKQVKMSADRHHKLKVLAAKENREMREIIEEAFDKYINDKEIKKRNE